MKQICCTAVLALALLFSAYAQREYGEKTGPTCEEIEMEQAALIFEREVNAYLSGKKDASTLASYTMDDADINFWIGQFEWTEDVLTQITPEEFYNKIEGWGSEARTVFLGAIAGADSIRVMEHQVKFDPTPGLRINRSANMIVYVYQKGQAVEDLEMTLVECRGGIKLIQAQ